MVYFLLRCLALSLWFLLFVWRIESSQAQSSSIDFNGASTRHLGAGVIRSGNAKHDRWDRILDLNLDRFRENATIRVDELPKILGELGLPVVIDQSVEDDAGSDATFQLPLAGSSLRTRLLHGLEKINLCWTFGESSIKIVSLDSATDEHYFFLVSYDVSQGSTNPQRDIQNVSTLITNSVTPDEWQMTQGEQSISPTVINGHAVLVICARYETHRKIERLFDQLSALTTTVTGPVGESVFENTNVALGQANGSVPIEMPPARKDQNPRSPGPTQISTPPKSIGGTFSIPSAG